MKIKKRIKEEKLTILENKEEKEKDGKPYFRGTCIIIRDNITKNLQHKIIIKGRLQMVVLPALDNTKVFNLYMPSGSTKVKEELQ